MTSLRVLITAGPSREYFDDIRFLSNASSGKLGIAMAEASARRGWTTHLCLGPTDREIPSRVEHHPFVSAEELDRRTAELWPEVDALVAAAAVCDYRPAARVPGKKKKGDDVWRPELVRTPDVLARRAQEKGARTLVGFALEPGLEIAEAERKLVEKSLDLIILNATANLGSERGAFHWIEAAGARDSWPDLTKKELAEKIAEFLARSARPSERA